MLAGLAYGLAAGAVPGLVLGRLATGAFNRRSRAGVRAATFAWSALAAAFLAQRPGLPALVRERAG
ncbi:hypothetical protein [Actinomadura sp. NEAU-AAG7]|uniref:hypothetical protein n=1 Tax=Actinomadura sp. NEAU-AAG7 TaxID=2839640 RepID=UPI001BE42495|nr:hypothetical protein [Actinomadura sp. NEAU-AAG7]MBT2211853.1 hypothetical protein [Actinomadura sp. NEAU-AAG7]